MTHVLRNLLALTALLWLGAALADGGKVEPCLECHFADDFKGERVDDIVAMIRRNAEGDNGHPSDLSGLTEADIAEIASYLSRGGED